MLSSFSVFRLLLSADASPGHAGHPEQHPAVRRAGLHTEHSVSSARPRPHRQAAQRGPRLHQGLLHSQRTRQGRLMSVLRCSEFTLTFLFSKFNLSCMYFSAHVCVASWLSLREDSNCVTCRDCFESSPV